MFARKCVNEEHGQAIIIIALLMVALLSMVGLLIDGGILIAERRSLQGAADAAAGAAAMDIKNGNTVAAATASARLYAAKAGYDNNGITNGVSVAIPPTSGAWSGNSSFAQVTVTRTLSTLLIQIVYHGTSSASASATAGLTTVPVPYAIVALNPTACGALSVDNNGRISDGDDVHLGAIMVDSSCPTAFQASNNATVRAGSIDVVGGYSAGNSATVSPAPNTGASYLADPLARVPVPDLIGMTTQSGSPDNPTARLVTNGQTVTLSPGIYYGGIVVNNNATVTFQPGTYVIAGGGFGVSNNGVLNGNGGVFIYNTRDSAHPTGAGAYGPIAFSNNANVNLAPPSSGPYKGLLFFQDRSNTSSFILSNNGSTTGGSIYAPAAACTLGNNAATFRMSQLICDTVHVSNNAVVDNEYNADRLYQVPSASLVN